MASSSEATRPAVLVMTQGDPSGIGPDITLSAWQRRTAETPRFAVVGDPALYAARAALLGLDVRVAETDMTSAQDVFADALPVIPTGHRVRGQPGTPSTSDATATLASIESAVGLLHNGSAAAMVTNPIAKHVLYDAGFPHPGHTEFLGELAAQLWGVVATPVMLLWSEILAVVPVTIHVALKAVPLLLSRDLIVETARIVDREMRERFGIARPRIACAGLNPHAGEGGSMGREEIDTIIPALDQLRAEGLAIEGPLSADTMFHAAARRGYDVALTMYHDQGLIPIKTLGFDQGVNVTLGLPFLRTSPDHGTAFGIAGKGTADPSSLIAAIGLAARLAGGVPARSGG